MRVLLQTATRVTDNDELGRLTSSNYDWWTNLIKQKTAYNRLDMNFPFNKPMYVHARQFTNSIAH